jgi:anti-sigma28 factor (negative regulator of flagellin synthesis)
LVVPAPPQKKFLKIVQGFLKLADSINNHGSKLHWDSQPLPGRLVTEQEGKYMENRAKVIEHTPPRQQLRVIMKAILRVRQAPEIRQEKIQPLHHAIRANTYRIDCRKLADCLIASLMFGLLR